MGYLKLKSNYPSIYLVLLAFSTYSAYKNDSYVIKVGITWASPLGTEVLKVAKYCTES